MVIKTNTKEIKEESAPKGYKFIADSEGRMSLKKIRTASKEIKVEAEEDKIVIKKSKKRYK